MLAPVEEDPAALKGLKSPGQIKNYGEHQK